MAANLSFGNDTNLAAYYAGLASDDADSAAIAAVAAAASATQASLNAQRVNWYGSAQFPPENGWSTSEADNGEFRLPGFKTGFTGAGSDALWVGAASIVAFVDLPREQDKAENNNPCIAATMWNEGNHRSIRLAWQPGWHATSGQRNTFRLHIWGDSTASGAWRMASATLPDDAVGPFAVWAWNDGDDGYLHVYDIGADTWHDGTGVAKPSGWAGVPIITNDLAIGGDGSYAFPKDNSAALQSATQWRGAVRDILFCDDALSKSDIEAMVAGEPVVAVAAAAGATKHCHIPLVDRAGNISLDVDTTGDDMEAGLVQYGTILPGPSIIADDDAAYITLGRIPWPAAFCHARNATHAVAEIGGTFSGVSGALQYRLTSPDGRITYTEWASVQYDASGSDWTASISIPASIEDYFQVQTRFSSHPHIVASSHSQCLCGIAVACFGQSEMEFSLLYSPGYSAQGIWNAFSQVNVRSEGRTDTVMFFTVGNNSSGPGDRAFIKRARFLPGFIGDAAMTFANELRRVTNKPIFILQEAVGGTALNALMNDSATSRKWSDLVLKAEMFANRGPNGEYIMAGAVIGGWEAAYSGTTGIMADWYRPFFQGIGSGAGASQITQANLNHWLYDGTFSMDLQVVMLAANRVTTQSTLAATDANTEADQRDVMRNYSHLFGYLNGPPQTTHKMQGENAAGGVPAGGVTHAELNDLEGTCEMAVTNAEAVLMAGGMGRYPGPVFFESIAPGSAANKVVVTLGNPRMHPGEGLAPQPTAGYSTDAIRAAIPSGLALHVKKDGGDPGAGFEARIDGGSWSKANVTAGEIISGRQVELTLASTPSVSVEVRYHPGHPGNYDAGTITQEAWRSGALFFTGEELPSGTVNADIHKVGWAVSGSNKVLELVL